MLAAIDSIDVSDSTSISKLMSNIMGDEAERKSIRGRVLDKIVSSAAVCSYVVVVL
jgi:hypothetical protein